MNKITLGIAAIAIMVLAGAGWYFNDSKDGGEDSGIVNNQSGGSVKHFNSDKYGIAFDYSSVYYLEERQASGSGMRDRYTIVMFEDIPENRNLAPGREGPTAITVDIFQNNLDKQTAEQWIKNSSNSNYKLSPDGVLSSATIDGKQGLKYRSSGLYESDNIVVATDRHVYMFAVTWLTGEDQIRKDFEEMIKTVELKDPPISSPVTIPENPGDGIVCIQVITPARNKATGEVRDFPTPCDVPAGWEKIGP